MDYYMGVDFRWWLLFGVYLITPLVILLILSIRGRKKGGETT
jgi:hypothetical protein